MVKRGLLNLKVLISFFVNYNIILYLFKDNLLFSKYFYGGLFTNFCRTNGLRDS